MPTEPLPQQHEAILGSLLSTDCQHLSMLHDFQILMTPAT